MTRVLIADDHALVRDGLRHILQGASGFEVVGEACDSASAVALIRERAADVMVLDLSMPGRNGVELIKQIKEEKPALRILVLTMHAEQQYAVRAFKAGASGYLTKESASAELVAAVTKVAAGGVYVVATASGDPHELIAGKGRYEHLSWSEKSDNAATAGRRGASPRHRAGRRNDV